MDKGRKISVKDLYLAKSVGELNKLAGDMPKVTNARLFIKSAEKVFKNAEHCSDLGDEEKAFVMYMKFFNIVQAVKKTSDYKKNDKYYNSLIGSKNLLKAITEAESLSQNLKDRYDLKEAEEVKRKLDAIDQEQAEKKKKEDEEKEKEKKEAENKKEKTEAPAADPGSIPVAQLYKLLQDGETSFILMDIRSPDQFETSRINYKSCINVPAAIIPPGCTVNKIEQALPEASKELWSQRGNVDFIVLLDWSCSAKKLETGSTLKSLKDALFKWDSSTIIKSEPLVLEGGYDEWLLVYPTLTTNANVARPPTYDTVASPVPSLDFDYPDFDTAFIETPDPREAQSPTDPPTNQNDVNQSNRTSPPKTIQSIKGSIVPTIDRSKKPKPGDSNRNVDRKSMKSINIIDNLAGDTKNSDRESSSQKIVDVKNINTSLGFRKESNIDKEMAEKSRDATRAAGNQPAQPSVNRANKPSLEVKPLPSAAQLLNGPQGEVLKGAIVNAAQIQVKKKMSEKEEELKHYKQINEKLIAEGKARRAKLEKEQNKIDKLQEMKNQESQDVAELMRQKRKIQDEIRGLDEQKNKMEQEQKWRQDELEQLKQEERRESAEGGASEMKSLAEEEKMRQQREVMESIAKERKQREAEEKILREQKANEEREKAEKQRQEELERARKEQEKVENERLRQEEAKRKAQEEAQKRAAEEARRKAAAEKAQQEQEARQGAKEESDIQEIQAKQREQVAKKIEAPGLSVGWEKRLDMATGRYYYIDHTTQSTHWQPPQHVIKSPVPRPVDSTTDRKPGTYKAKLKEEPSTPKTGGLKRSHSSPNIAQLALDEDEQQVKVPVPRPLVDRSCKPKPVVEVQTPIVPEDIYSARSRNFNPTYGSVGRGLTGLRNLGNTCYMNSIIQSLSHTTPLVTYLITDTYRFDLNRDNFLGCHGEIAEEFAAVIKTLWSGQYRSISPRDFKGTVGKYQPMFAGYEQQDSQELLLFIMDGLHEDLNKIKKRVQIPEQQNDGVIDKIAAEKAWQMHKTVNESIIVELFQGQFKSIVMCLKCEKQSVTYDAFMYLSLPLPSNTRCSLQDCMKTFAKEEKMTGESRWMCPRCKCKRDAVKKIIIWKLPPILLIHLKRFYHDGMWRQKINAYVDFPINGLDIGGHVAGPSRGKEYNLYAVSNHYGTMEGGHYTAYCKNPNSQKWYKFDDHEVYDISKSDIKTSAAYILFYTCMEMKPPMSPLK